MKADMRISVKDYCREIMATWVILYFPGTEIKSKAQNPKSKVAETSNGRASYVVPDKGICAIKFGIIYLREV